MPGPKMAERGAMVVQLRATSTAAPPMAGVERVIERLADFPMELLLDAVPREG